MAARQEQMCESLKQLSAETWSTEYSTHRLRLRTRCPSSTAKIHRLVLHERIPRGSNGQSATKFAMAAKIRKTGFGACSVGKTKQRLEGLEQRVFRSQSSDLSHPHGMKLAGSPQVLRLMFYARIMTSRVRTTMIWWMSAKK